MGKDDFVKTALRLPRALRDDIKAAAEAAGRSMNDEIITRLQLAPESVAASAILAKIEQYEGTARDVEKRRADALWRIVERAQRVLAQVEPALASQPGNQEMAALQREIEFLRELVSAVAEHR